MDDNLFVNVHGATPIPSQKQLSEALFQGAELNRVLETHDNARSPDWAKHIAIYAYGKLGPFIGINQLIKLVGSVEYLHGPYYHPTWWDDAAKLVLKKVMEI